MGKGRLEAFSDGVIAGGVLLMAAIAYYRLVRALIASHGSDSEFAARVGSDWKGKILWSCIPLESGWRS